ncbi:MAG: c-type cytochrome [Actinomycetota bacterium]
MNQAGSVKVWVIAFVVAAVVGFGTLIGVGCALGANACPFTKQKPVTTTDGRTLYQLDCAVCHGLEGQGGTGLALKSGTAATYTVSELESKIGNGKPLAGMPAFKRQLTPEQIRAVAEYVFAFRRNP